MSDHHRVTPWYPHEPTARERLSILRATRTVAILGFSDMPDRASYFVTTYLQQETSYALYPVNPSIAGKTVLGLTVFGSLAELPESVDVVDVFRRPADLPGVVDETVAAGASVLWTQLGVVHDEAIAEARARGLTVVSDRCLKIEHARFHGGLHLGGFDTGQISARKTFR